jgi:hypothetical protein
MHDEIAELVFTGEYFIPGKSGERIEADHLERYRFACRFAKGKSVLDLACGAGYSHGNRTLISEWSNDCSRRLGGYPTFG